MEKPKVCLLPKSLGCGVMVVSLATERASPRCVGSQHTERTALAGSLPHLFDLAALE